MLLTENCGPSAVNYTSSSETSVAPPPSQFRTPSDLTEEYKSQLVSPEPCSQQLSNSSEKSDAINSLWAFSSFLEQHGPYILGDEWVFGKVCSVPLQVRKVRNHWTSSCITVEPNEYLHNVIVVQIAALGLLAETGDIHSERDQ
ncbi:hypothetical protein CEXT_254951 [Caerostris extrusa]|uniref:Uncharacterized protein n=1 Tax=Caerostris extrusa TaxID=172846 RepID=A0AAV4RXL4_CAEEX|nr:hypothetical protein CEXT_254951 [Caerostris extrusa]